MSTLKIYQSINYFTALVWLVNGLCCKVFNMVPRHQQIVELILNLSNGRSLTMLIGYSEVIMVVWILSRVFPKLNVITQIIIVMTMNIIEQLLAGDMLLWGKMNFLFAICFCLLIAYNEFVLKKTIQSQSLNPSDV